MDRARLPRPDAAELQGRELKGLGLPSAWLQLPVPAVEPDQTLAGNGNGVSAGIAGGVLLDGELQHNPEWGISVDDRQPPEKQKPKLEMDDSHQDAEKKKMRDQLEQQRTERNRQQGRQRAIEQSRQPSGGGMPL